MTGEKAGRQPCFDFLDELIVPDPLDEQPDNKREPLLTDEQVKQIEAHLASPNVPVQPRTMINMHTKGRVIE